MPLRTGHPNAPLVGIPTYNAYNGAPEFVMLHSYCRAILAAGGVPVLLPLIDDESHLYRLYDVIDGLLLAGGGDVATHFYEAKDSGKLTLIDEQRDRVEITLSRWALAEGMPILAICRGMQLLNVAAGGTLIQDIPSEVPGALVHRVNRSLSGNYVAHEVKLATDSLVRMSFAEAGALGPSCLGVNSRHHQAVRDVAPGFQATAHAPDGIIEAIEPINRDGAFVLGVQWHPENFVPDDEVMLRLFRAFVNACQR